MLKGLGARAAAMSGSGGAVFGVFDDTEAVACAAREAVERAPAARVISARTLRES